MDGAEEELDLNALADLEEDFINEGFEAGIAHGEALGFEEGLAIGKQRGIELGEELGNIFGTVLLWRQLFDAPGAANVSARLDSSF